MTKPITIRGVTYPSRVAAGRAIGVSPGMISKAEIRGTLDHVGIGSGGTAAKPITIRGVTYPSQKAAAEALGVSIHSIARAVQRGQPDRAGILAKRSKPVTIRGTTYPSQTAAAEALGVSHQAVAKAVDPDRIGLGKARSGTYKGKKYNSISSLVDEKNWNYRKAVKVMSFDDKSTA